MKGKFIELAPAKINLFLNGNEIVSHELSYETNE